MNLGLVFAFNRHTYTGYVGMNTHAQKHKHVCVVSCYIVMWNEYTKHSLIVCSWLRHKPVDFICYSKFRIQNHDNSIHTTSSTSIAPYTHIWVIKLPVLMWKTTQMIWNYSIHGRHEALKQNSIVSHCLRIHTPYRLSHCTINAICLGIKCIKVKRRL